MRILSWLDAILPIAVLAATIPVFVATYFQTIRYGGIEKSNDRRRGVVLFSTGWPAIVFACFLSYLLFVMCVHSTMTQPQLSHLPFFGWGASVCLIVIFAIADSAAHKDELKLPRSLWLAQIGLAFGTASTILRSLQLAHRLDQPKVAPLLHDVSVFTGACCLAIFVGLAVRLVVDYGRFIKLEAEDRCMSADSMPSK